MGWITAIMASGPVRQALGWVLAALTITLFLLNLRRAGERTGRLAERNHPIATALRVSGECAAFN